jgi:hypothetical protein
MDPCDPGTCCSGLGCFYFSNGTTTVQICQPFEANDAGQTNCDLTGACPDGFSCQGQVCGNASLGICVANPIPVGVGAPCTLAAPDCQLNDPSFICIPHDQAVGSDGTCVQAQQLGSPCTHIFECGGVDSTAWCDPAQHVCVPRPDAGSPCAMGPAFDGGISLAALCNVTNSWCDTTQHQQPTCMPYLPAGSACTRDSQCGPSWMGNTCGPPAVVSNCAGTVVDAGVPDGGWTCVAPQAAPSCSE